MSAERVGGQLSYNSKFETQTLSQNQTLSFLYDHFQPLSALPSFPGKLGAVGGMFAAPTYRDARHTRMYVLGCCEPMTESRFVSVGVFRRVFWTQKIDFFFQKNSYRSTCKKNDPTRPAFILVFHFSPKNRSVSDWVCFVFRREPKSTGFFFPAEETKTENRGNFHYRFTTLACTTVAACSDRV